MDDIVNNLNPFYTTIDPILKHYIRDQQLKEALNNDFSASDIIGINTRILHCPPGTTLDVDTNHDELRHIKINYVIRTCIYSVFIAFGLLFNFHVLAVLQYFSASTMRVVLRAEVVALTAYLMISILVYPLAHLYPYTGQFFLYELAKPYMLYFFATCLDVAEFMYIWIFVWMVRIRHTLVVYYGKPKAERCTVKAVRDEMRLMTCFAIIINLPKFFDTELAVISDPCNPGTFVVLREANTFGKNVMYLLFYRVIGVSLLYYIIPFMCLISFSYRTHNVLRKSERPTDDSKEKIMKERMNIEDGPALELDKRMLFFFCLLLPGSVFNVAKYIQYAMPKRQSTGYQTTIDIIDMFTTLLTIIHAALAPFIVYWFSFPPFKEKAIEKYWSKLATLREKYKRNQAHKLELEAVEARLEREDQKRQRLLSAANVSAASQDNMEAEKVQTETV